ncbi:MAG TPA: helix-turn-helix domain-containing protein, partial [Pyrinomonadaceae bacterium]|nr:helix-turn-helix domain-containing protein [Pyrinomonadaceae bacterium]
QETAKNLVTRSIEIFDEVGQPELVAEARGDLALCYWREGAFDEARINLADALSYLPEEDILLKAMLLIRAGIVELWTQRLSEALRFYNEAEPLVERSGDNALKGAFHNEFALLFRRLGAAESRTDYLDRALIEYAAASFYFEKTGHTRYRARVENNLGFLYLTIGKFADAHEHINNARQMFVSLGDRGGVAQVDDTRARALLAEGRLTEAERFARSAVKTLERGGEQSLLTGALTTEGTVLARMGKHAKSRASLRHAIEVAETAGDLEGASRARLSIIEELAPQTSAEELVALYQSAADLLTRSQDPLAAQRLVACSSKVIEALGVSDAADPQPQELNWDGYSLKEHMRRIEKAIIERALRDSGGAVTRATRLLGMNHHQSLIAVINGRHKDLLGVRTAVRVRRRSIISKGKGRSKKNH